MPGDVEPERRRCIHGAHRTKVSALACELEDALTVMRDAQAVRDRRRQELCEAQEAFEGAAQAARVCKRQLDELVGGYLKPADKEGA